MVTWTGDLACHLVGGNQKSKSGTWSCLTKYQDANSFVGNSAIELAFGSKPVVELWWQNTTLSHSPSDHHTPTTQKVSLKVSIASEAEISIS